MFTTPMMMKNTLQSLRLALSLGLIATYLAACSTAPIEPGATQADVIAKYGKPTAVVTLPASASDASRPGGTRLQYSAQPAGQTAFMVDLDPAGQVTMARQVLNPSDFSRVTTSQWTKSDTLREFGRPASVERVGNWSGDILVYRWKYANDDMLFYVYLDANQIVQQTGTAVEYRREPWK